MTRIGFNSPEGSFRLSFFSPPIIVCATKTNDAMTSPLRVALLVVSDTAAKDPTTDASASVLGQVLADEGSGKWELVETKIVADSVTQIQRQIMLWADVAAHNFNLVLTTGGTGFAVSDNTPEVSSRN